MQKRFTSLDLESARTRNFIGDGRKQGTRTSMRGWIYIRLKYLKLEIVCIQTHTHK